MVDSTESAREIGHFKMATFGHLSGSKKASLELRADSQPRVALYSSQMDSFHITPFLQQPFTLIVLRSNPKF